MFMRVFEIRSYDNSSKVVLPGFVAYCGNFLVNSWRPSFDNFLSIGIDRLSIISCQFVATVVQEKTVANGAKVAKEQTLSFNGFSLRQLQQFISN